MSDLRKILLNGKLNFEKNPEKTAKSNEEPKKTIKLKIFSKKNVIFQKIKIVHLQ